MAVVKPFRGIIYNTGLVEAGDVVAPPYDVINERMQEELYRRSPYNIVRVILGKDQPGDDERNNKYTRAREFLDRWLGEGILTQLPQEHFFAYHQSFSVNGQRFTRKAIVARVRLEDFSSKVIIPHERTLSAPKRDRLMLFKSTRMNLSPVFGIALDDGSVFSLIEASPKRLLFEFEDADGVSHSFYAMEPSVSEEIASAFSDKRILIADGHHRYETALNYKREMEAANPNHTGEEPYNYVMMAIVSSKDPGLVVLPIHRVIKNVEEERVKSAASAIESQFEKIREIKREDLFGITNELKGLGKRHFAHYEGPGGSIFRIGDDSQELDVVVLHNRVLHGVLGISEEEIREKRKIEYFKSISDALEYLEKGGRMILSYIPPTVEEIASYSMSGRVMPQKSTYFFPKFYSGLVLYSLRD